MKKLFCSLRTQFKLVPRLVKALQVPDARRTKEFVQSPESHPKWPVTPSDEQDYEEDRAQASFEESRMEFAGPCFKQSMLLGPRETI